MKVSNNLAPGTLNSIMKQSSLKKGVPMRYAIVIEKIETNYFAYFPDLPGCVATGYSIEEVEAETCEAIAFHIEGMREDGCLIPAPSSQVEYVEVAAQ